MSEPFSNAGGIGPYTPSIVGGTGTTTKIFPSLLGPGFGNGGNPLSSVPGSTKPAIPVVAAATPAALVTIPGTGQYEQQAISVSCSGFVFVHGTSPTLNFLFQQGTSLTSGSNTTMATLASAQSLTTNASYPFAFNCRIQADSVSGVMQVYSGVFVCNGVSGSLTLTDLTGINLTTTNYSFVFGVTFGVSDATNVGVLSQFSLTAA
jgi:hypothetical protein